MAVVVLTAAGRAGARAAALGLARALKLPTAEVAVRPPLPLLPAAAHVAAARWLPLPLARWAAGLPTETNADTASVAIASGRRTAAAAVALQRSAAAAKRPPLCTVLLGLPAGVSPLAFDAVAAPAVDFPGGAPAPNVLLSAGPLGPIDAEALARARDGALQARNSPRVCLLVGGDTRRRKASAGAGAALAASVAEAVRRRGGTLLVSFSARTAAAGGLERAMRAAVAGAGVEAVVWSPGGAERPNPYRAFLAAADAVVATDDSFSMLADSAAAGRPLYHGSLDGARAGGKAGRQLALLEAAGVAREWRGALEEPWEYEAPREAERVARFVRGAMASTAAPAAVVRPNEAPSNATSSEGQDVEHQPGPAIAFRFVELGGQKCQLLGSEDGSELYCIYQDGAKYNCDSRSTKVVNAIGETVGWRYQPTTTYEWVGGVNQRSETNAVTGLERSASNTQHQGFEPPSLGGRPATKLPPPVLGITIGALRSFTQDPMYDSDRDEFHGAEDLRVDEDTVLQSNAAGNIARRMVAPQRRKRKGVC